MNVAHRGMALAHSQHMARMMYYFRVSTDGQTVENQRLELDAAAERHGWHIVQVFQDRGISSAKGRDTSTPAGKALFQMLGVFAEFERSMIRERVMAGLKRAKANRKTLGRPKVDGDAEKGLSPLLSGLA